MITTIPDWAIKPIEERTLEELIETKKAQEAAIKKHKELAAWGNVESKYRLQELRANKKKTEEYINKLKES